MTILRQHRNILANENAMQEEVNETYTKLIKAFLELRFKPNKDLLNELINKANGLSEANYTASSWKVMNEVLNDAIVVLNDAEANQVEVNKVKDVLAKRLAGLVVDSAVETVKPEDKTASVKTGDDSVIATTITLMPLSLAEYYIFKKKNFRLVLIKFYRK